MATEWPYTSKVLELFAIMAEYDNAEGDITMLVDLPQEWADLDAALAADGMPSL